MTAPGISLPQEVLYGINLINLGEYFHAHEVLEKVWLQEAKPVKQLYQGLIKVSVLLYHLEKNNRKGALKLISKTFENLEPFGDIHEPINVNALIEDLRRMQERINLINNKNPDLSVFRIFI